MTLHLDARVATQRLLAYIDASPSPFHAVLGASELLEAAGFRPLREEEAWKLTPGGRHYVVRNGSTLGAFVLGRRPPSGGGFHLIGAHTDSPNLRLKPLPDIERSGYMQLGVEIYGGVLLASWLDRDLGLAGRVLVDAGDGAILSRLILARRPLARVPQLAIHLNRDVNEQGLVLNKEQQMVPVVGLAGGRGFRSWLAETAEVEPDRILAHELMLFDVNPPCFSGFDEDFVHAPRLDNLASCHAALTALVETADLEVDSTRAIVLYDNEEVGSATAQGAAGSFLEDLLERIVSGLGESGEASRRARAQSFLISADMAHAVHPNYADKHESRHQPRMNEGPVIKMNANARYATDAESAAVFSNLARAAEVPVQRFVMRADMPCGSTIGPLVATRLGIKTVDVGNPMLSMHSCREMAGSRDHGLMIRALAKLFEAAVPVRPAL